MNDISLTVRIPDKLNDQLTLLSKGLGITKVSLLRFTIWSHSDNPKPLSFDTSATNSFRFVLSLNAATYKILEDASKQYSQPVNSVVVALANIAVKSYSKYL